MIKTLQEFKTYLKATKKFIAKDIDGTEFEFEIRPVPIFTWDPSGEWFTYIRPGKEKEFSARLKQSMERPAPEVLRMVLMKGTVTPKVSEADGPDSLSIDDLMSRDILALNVYAEIVTFSFHDFIKAKLESDARPSTGT